MKASRSSALGAVGLAGVVGLLAACASTPGSTSQPATSPAKPVARRAVVLGSGGLVGGAWEVAVLKGLRDQGLDLTTADEFVGSSAGASFGARLLLGQSIDDLLAARLAQPTPAESGVRSRSPEDLQYFQETSKMWGPAATDVAARIALGQRALGTPHPIPQDVQVATYKRSLNSDHWPDRLLKIAAVDVSDGSVRFFDKTQGVPIELAVAASTSQPGLQAPVSIGDRQYMDGGTAGINLEGAADAAIVVVIAPYPGPGAAQAVQALSEHGQRAVLVTRDADASSAMGTNLADPGHQKPAAENGLRQAGIVAGQLRAVWGGA